jgi:hypothetical protein
MSELLEPRKLPDEFRRPGAVIPTPEGQVYRLERVEPYQRRDGMMTSIAVWSSACADCGAPFVFTEPLGRFPGNRRCTAHQAPGRRVPGPWPARKRAGHHNRTTVRTTSQR